MVLMTPAVTAAGVTGGATATGLGAVRPRPRRTWDRPAAGGAAVRGAAAAPESSGPGWDVPVPGVTTAAVWAAAGAGESFGEFFRGRIAAAGRVIPAPGSVEPPGPAGVPVGVPVDEPVEVSRPVGFADRARGPAVARDALPGEGGEDSAEPDEVSAAPAGAASESPSAAAVPTLCGPARLRPSAIAAAPTRAPRLAARLIAARQPGPRGPGELRANLVFGSTSWSIPPAGVSSAVGQSTCPGPTIAQQRDL